MDDPHQVLHRAVTSAAAPEVLAAWVGQLRVAPYSYDWIDNLGRRSPNRLTGFGPPEPGERINAIFEVVGSSDREVTMRFAAGWFGEVVCTYLVEPWAGGSRLIVRFAVRYADGPVAAVLSWLLPAGDLVMMRRQLLNLARLAEGRS